MRALLDPDGPDPATPEGLYERYRPEPAPWVRANFICSVDGAATLAGVSGGLGTDADRAVFAVLRDHADTVLVGAGTVRAEGYGSISASPDRQARRRQEGRDAAPRLAVLGRANSWTGDEPWLAGALAPPLLLTSARAAADVPGAETVVCGDDSVDIGRALDVVTAGGSVLCEGGPGLFAQVAGSGRLDELCLSVSPTLAGPGPGRITTGSSWPAPRSARLVGLLEDDGLLLCRYRLG